MGPSHLGYLHLFCLEAQMIFVSAAMLVLVFFLWDLPGPLWVWAIFGVGVFLLLSQ